MDREALFNENLEWAVNIARNIASRMPSSFEAADLIQEATIEHWKRCEQYDPTLGVPYQGYAYRPVRGAVLMKCRRRHWAEAMHEGIDASEADQGVSPEQELVIEDEAREQTERRAAIVRTLPELEAYFVLKVHIQGVDPSALAAVWPPEEIGRRLRRGLKLLREQHAA